jgi:hypothetical protein
MRLIGEITKDEVLSNNILGEVELLKYYKDKFNLTMFNEDNLEFHYDSDKNIYQLYRQSWEDV